MLVCAKSLQLCLTLCSPMHHSPPGSSVHGIFLARLLEWVAISYSRESSQPRDRIHLVSCVSTLQEHSLPLGPPEKALKRHGIYTQNTQHIIKYYSVMRKTEFLPFSTMWMDFDHIMLSEISQTKTGAVW